jgi:hypothetical protein
MVIRKTPGGPILGWLDTAHFEEDWRGIQGVLGPFIDRRIHKIHVT